MSAYGSAGFRLYLNFDKLLTEVRREAPATLHRWDRPVFRTVALKWAKPDRLLSGRGAFRHGSRWLLPGISPVFYGASTGALALKEARRNLAHFHIAPNPRLALRPSVIVEVAAQVEVVDLSRLCAKLPWPDLEELLSGNWEAANARHREALSQALGRALWQLGYAGLVAPSSRDRRGRNLVTFTDNFGTRDRLRVQHEEELKKWLAP